MKTDLLAAIAAFNKSSQPQITVLTTRDGRTLGKLPRVGRDIVVQETALNPNIKVTPGGLALLCEEARLASAPGLALLDAGLAALKTHAAD